jgi:hypothetical protein
MSIHSQYECLYALKPAHSCDKIGPPAEKGDEVAPAISATETVHHLPQNEAELEKKAGQTSGDCGNCSWSDEMLEREHPQQSSDDNCPSEPYIDEQLALQLQVGCSPPCQNGLFQNASGSSTASSKSSGREENDSCSTDTSSLPTNCSLQSLSYLVRPSGYVELEEGGCGSRTHQTQHSAGSRLENQEERATGSGDCSEFDLTTQNCVLGVESSNLEGGDYLEYDDAAQGSFVNVGGVTEGVGTSAGTVSSSNDPNYVLDTLILAVSTS